MSIAGQCPQCRTVGVSRTLHWFDQGPEHHLDHIKCSNGHWFSRSARLSAGRHDVAFSPTDCGGAYDGIGTVYSDADPGL